MAKLTDKANIKITATICLIKQYLGDPDFKEAFEQVCQPYEPLINGFTAEYLSTHKNAVALPSHEIEKIIDSLREKCIASLGTDFLLSSKALQGLLSSFFREIKEIAYKWHLKTPEALMLLFATKVMDIVLSYGIKMRPRLDFHPAISADVPPLKLGVIEPRVFSDMGQKEICEVINNKIADYMAMFKESGLVKYPYKLDKHAYWWFQATVKGKAWGDLADEEAQVKVGGISPENIRKAEKCFSSLIEMETP